MIPEAVSFVFRKFELSSLIHKWLQEKHVELQLEHPPRKTPRTTRLEVYWEWWSVVDNNQLSCSSLIQLLLQKSFQLKICKWEFSFKRNLYTLKRGYTVKSFCFFFCFVFCCFCFVFVFFVFFIFVFCCFFFFFVLFFFSLLKRTALQGKNAPIASDYFSSREDSFSDGIFALIAVLFVNCYIVFTFCFIFLTYNVSLRYIQLSLGNICHCFRKDCW